MYRRQLGDGIKKRDRRQCEAKTARELATHSRLICRLVNDRRRRGSSDLCSRSPFTYIYFCVEGEEGGELT